MVSLLAAVGVLSGLWVSGDQFLMVRFEQEKILVFDLANEHNYTCRAIDRSMNPMRLVCQDDMRHLLKVNDQSISLDGVELFHDQGV